MGTTESFRTPETVGASMAFSLGRLGTGDTAPLTLDLTTPPSQT
ncbi:MULTISPECIES: hypothetical protein [Streptomyces]|nr:MULTISPECIES: hypothetical protein [Streptomyces]